MKAFGWNTVMIQVDRGLLIGDFEGWSHVARIENIWGFKAIVGMSNIMDPTGGT
jgi:hypothetical protein